MVECARIAVRYDSRLGEFYQRVKRRRREQKALVAVACKMLKIIWFMLTRGEPYRSRMNVNTAISLIGFVGIRLNCWLRFSV